jgi:hypothetical protein
MTETKVVEIKLGVPRVLVNAVHSVSELVSRYTARVKMEPEMADNARYLVERMPGMTADKITPAEYLRGMDAAGAITALCREAWVAEAALTGHKSFRIYNLPGYAEVHMKLPTLVNPEALPHAMRTYLACILFPDDLVEEYRLKDNKARRDIPVRAQLKVERDNRYFLAGEKEFRRRFLEGIKMGDMLRESLDELYRGLKGMGQAMNDPELKEMLNEDNLKILVDTLSDGLSSMSARGEPIYKIMEIFNGARNIADQDGHHDQLIYVFNLLYNYIMCVNSGKISLAFSHKLAEIIAPDDGQVSGNSGLDMIMMGIMKERSE